jgi:leucyl-tRNA synthetase
VRVPAGSDSKVIEAAALAEEKVKARIAGKNVAKIIVVPGRAVNLVVRPSDKDLSPGTPVVK